MTLWYPREKAKDIGKRTVSVSFVDAKVDGWMLDLAKTADDQPLAATRSDDVWSKLRDVQYFKTIMSRLPPGSAVQGELYVPGRPASEVPHMLATDVKQLMYVAHSIPAWEGSEPGATADLNPYVVEAMLRRLGCRVVPRWHLDPQLKAEEVTSSLSAFDVDANQAVALLLLLRKDLENEKYRPSLGYAVFASPKDVEGLVLKGKHFGSWWKYKATKTVDLVCTGLEDGSGAFTGCVGSLVGSVWRDGALVEVASVSGMDEDTRFNIGEEDIGRVFECEYQYLGAGNKLRHPRFKRWRDDKPAEECTWQSLEC